ncbi:MAG: hypothetical protein R2788_15290 [Saprospiraceae bacterium]
MLRRTQLIPNPCGPNDHSSIDLSFCSALQGFKGGVVPMHRDDTAP